MKPNKKLVKQRKERSMLKNITYLPQKLTKTNYNIKIVSKVGGRYIPSLNSKYGANKII
jgi:hypothetical protein